MFTEIVVLWLPLVPGWRGTAADSPIFQLAYARDAASLMCDCLTHETHCGIDRSGFSFRDAAAANLECCEHEKYRCAALLASPRIPAVASFLIDVACLGV